MCIHSKPCIMYIERLTACHTCIHSKPCITCIERLTACHTCIHSKPRITTHTDLPVLLHKRHWEAGPKQTDGDAHAHGSCSDHTRSLHQQQLRVGSAGSTGELPLERYNEGVTFHFVYSKQGSQYVETRQGHATRKEKIGGEVERGLGVGGRGEGD